MPWAMEHVWGWYLHLRMMCPETGFAISRITEEQIFFWRLNSRIFVQPWEYLAICKLDFAYRKVMESDESEEEPE